MEITVVKLPKDLKPSDLANRAVVVFDVLRATTTIVTAIANGAKEVRIFGSLDTARLAASEFDGPKILAGEHKCLPPEGFDLGNSPGDFTAGRVAGKTIFLSTTNGTKAIVAARGATRLFAASVLNATAMGKYLAALGRDVTLLCAGTDGAEAREDYCGAYFVNEGIAKFSFLATPGSQEVQSLLEESAMQALRFQHFNTHKELALEFRQCQGGKNIIGAGLEQDIEFAARIDRFSIVVEITGDPPVARKMQQ